MKFSLMEVAIWAAAIISFIMVLWWAFGNSPTIDQLLVPVLLLMLGSIFETRIKMEKMSTEDRHRHSAIVDLLKRIEDAAKKIEENTRK